MKATKTVEETRCDRCGASKCVQFGADVLAFWRAADAMQSPDERVTDPDLCRRCVDRERELAKQARHQRRRAWSEKAAP